MNNNKSYTVTNVYSNKNNKNIDNKDNNNSNNIQ